MSAARFDPSVAARIAAWSALLAAFTISVPAHADDLIEQANNQESLILGVAHRQYREQALDAAHALVYNDTSGPQLQLGYAATRTRSLVGVPGFYTRLEISLGAGHEAYTGASVDPSSGAVGPSNGPFNLATETVRLRVGRTVALGPARPLALTPYLGLVQQAWLHNAATYSGTTVYNHIAPELGLLAQAKLTRALVLGADAAVGRTLGPLQAGSHDLTWTPNATTASLALYLDNRTDADWHQRLVIRQDVVRYGQTLVSRGFFEPRRDSAFSIRLEFGTELDLFKSLFY